MLDTVHACQEAHTVGSLQSKSPLICHRLLMFNSVRRRSTAITITTSSLLSLSNPQNPSSRIPTYSLYTSVCDTRETDMSNLLSTDGRTPFLSSQTQTDILDSGQLAPHVAPVDAAESDNPYMPITSAHPSVANYHTLLGLANHDGKRGVLRTTATAPRTDLEGLSTVLNESRRAMELGTDANHLTFGLCPLEKLDGGY
jgi:hypothetical protein